MDRKGIEPSTLWDSDLSACEADSISFDSTAELPALTSI